jgi:hypothetical protein
VTNQQSAFRRSTNWNQPFTIDLLVLSLARQTSPAGRKKIENNTLKFVVFNNVSIKYYVSTPSMLCFSYPAQNTMLNLAKGK